MDSEMIILELNEKMDKAISTLENGNYVYSYTEPSSK